MPTLCSPRSFLFAPLSRGPSSRSARWQRGWQYARIVKTPLVLNKLILSSAYVAAVGLLPAFAAVAAGRWAECASVAHNRRESISPFLKNR